MLNAETVLYCHADSTKPDVIEQNIAYFDALEGRVRASHVVEPLDEADLEALVGFPFDDVPGADQLNEEERAFYRPAHHAAIKAMIAWVQNTAD
jgi:hypothetical protein